jgi:hypothetical protein
LQYRRYKQAPINYPLAPRWVRWPCDALLRRLFEHPVVARDAHERAPDPLEETFWVLVDLSVEHPEFHITPLLRMTLDVYADLFESDLESVADNVAKMWPPGGPTADAFGIRKSH